LKNITDPCVLNPLQCGGPNSAGVVNNTGSGNTSSSTSTATSPVTNGSTSTVSAPLTIEANLTVATETRIATLNDMSAATVVAKASNASAAPPESKPASVSLGLVPSSLPADIGVRRAPSALAQELRKEADATRTLARIERETAQREEVQVRQAETQVRKVESDVRVAREEVRKAEADVKKAESDVSKARTPEEKAGATRQLAAKREEVLARQLKADMKQAEADVKKVQAEAKKAEVEARRVEAESKELQADSKTLMATARDLRSEGGRAVTQQRAQVKQVESEARQAVADVKKAQAAAAKADAEVRAAEADVKQAAAQARRETSEGGKPDDTGVKGAGKALEVAQRKLTEVKEKAEQAKSDVERRSVALEQKKSDLEKSVGALKAAETRRVDERRAEMMTMFGMMASSRMGKGAMDQAMALRQELKAEAFSDALKLLDSNPDAADLPACGGTAVVCVPKGAPVVKLPPVDMKPSVAFLPQIERKVAVMIGVNEYADPDVPSLDTALPDAQAVGSQLQQQFGYTVKTLPNATRADIVASLNSLAREVGPNDSVTVYYAGHGYLNEKTGAGYWIPADGKAASPANWISNRDITRLLGNIPARQVLLVSDSCYSGSLTKETLTGKVSAAPIDPARVLGKRSVTVLSSGGEEPVSDEGKNGHSIFAFNFMNALKDVANIGPAVNVFEAVKTGVAQDAPQQPQYGGVVSANHQAGGEFLFEVRSYNK
jgi:hypothetical protein